MFRDSAKMKMMWRAFIYNIAIVGIWYYLEYRQFGQLQMGRWCDNVVGLIYLFWTMYIYGKMADLQNNQDSRGVL